MGIPFNSLKAQTAPFENDLREAFERVMGRGWYLMGPEVDAFENELAHWLGRDHAITVGNGTDALILALRALGVGTGDEVILPAHTALPCYHAVLATGGVPVFAEVDEATYTLSPASVQRMLSQKTKAVMAVHLYGQSCDMDPIAEICRANGVALLEDCAQSHGATYKDRLAGQIGDAAAFSFYPTKNLGALGDGGAICCADAELDQRIRLLKQYGEASRYESVTAGGNSRMDEMQAAFLRIRLGRLATENAQRRDIAAIYDTQLACTPVITPHEREGCTHVYHLYVIRAPRREELIQYLREREIGTGIHYPIPGHKQKLFANGTAPCRTDDLALTEKMAGEILSLPIFPGMDHDDVRTVCDAIKAFYAQ